MALLYVVPLCVALVGETLPSSPELPPELARQSGGREGDSSMFSVRRLL